MTHRMRLLILQVFVLPSYFWNLHALWFVYVSCVLNDSRTRQSYPLQETNFHLQMIFHHNQSSHHPPLTNTSQTPVQMTTIPFINIQREKKVLLIPLYTKWPSRFGDKLYYRPPFCKPLNTPSPIFLPPIKIANTSVGHVWFVAIILIFIQKLSLLYASSRPIFTALLLHTKCAQREEGRREMKSRKRGELHYSTLVQLAMNMHDNNLTLQRIIL